MYKESHRKKKKTEYNSKYSKKNRVKMNNTLKSWSKENPDKVKNYVLKRKYNLTVEDYNKMFEEQKGCCYICGRHQSLFNKALHVDHCHDTKIIRKLLCVRCNNGLGFLDDDIDKLSKCIEYIKSYRT